MLAVSHPKTHLRPHQSQPSGQVRPLETEFEDLSSLHIFSHIIGSLERQQKSEAARPRGTDTQLLSALSLEDGSVLILHLEAQGEGGESHRRQNKLAPILVLDILGHVPARVEGEPGGLEGGHPLSDGCAHSLGSGHSDKGQHEQ